jgi:hypothetical protein
MAASARVGRDFAGQVEVGESELRRQIQTSVRGRELGIGGHEPQIVRHLPATFT